MYAVGLQPRINVDRAANWGFDFVAKKDSKVYFVDVKTNKAILQKHQKKDDYESQGIWVYSNVSQTKGLNNCSAGRCNHRNVLVVTASVRFYFSPKLFNRS